MSIFFTPRLQINKEAVKTVKVSSTSITINDEHHFTQNEAPNIIAALKGCGFYSDEQAKLLEKQLVKSEHNIQEIVGDVVSTYDYATEQQKKDAIDECLRTSDMENLNIEHLHRCAKSYSVQA